MNILSIITWIIILLGVGFKSEYPLMHTMSHVLAGAITFSMFLIVLILALNVFYGNYESIKEKMKELVSKDLINKNDVTQRMSIPKRVFGISFSFLVMSLYLSQGWIGLLLIQFLTSGAFWLYVHPTLELIKDEIQKEKI